MQGFKRERGRYENEYVEKKKLKKERNDSIYEKEEK